jgi:hypothetical protein
VEYPRFVDSRALPRYACSAAVPILVADYCFRPGVGKRGHPAGRVVERRCVRRPIEPGQYTSIDYTQTLDDHLVLASIGTVGDALDNALAESFVDFYETELISDRVWRSQAQLELATLTRQGESQRTSPVLRDQRDVPKCGVLSETQQELSVKVEGVGRVLHGLVRSTESEQVGSDDPSSTL